MRTLTLVCALVTTPSQEGKKLSGMDYSPCPDDRSRGLCMHGKRVILTCTPGFTRILEMAGPRGYGRKER